MRDIQELSYQEIADRLRLPEGTVKSRINRGRTELARQIRKLRGDDYSPSGTAPKGTGAHSMNVKTDQTGVISIVRVGETRLMYPILGDFASAVSALIAAGKREILIDLTPVTYVDSATIGCLMDLYRQVHGAGGQLKLVRRAEARRDDAHDDRRAEFH